MLTFHLHIKILFIKEVKLQCREISVHLDLYEMYCFCDFSHVSFKEEEGTGRTEDDREKQHESNVSNSAKLSYYTFYWHCVDLYSEVDVTHF